MLKILNKFLVVAITTFSFVALAVDMRQPPNAQTTKEIAELGWPKARDIIAEALVKNYRPGIGTAAGSTGVSTYVKWLTLWRWCDLLARSEAEHVKAELARHMFLVGGRFTFIPPGIAPTDECIPLDNERLSAFFDGEKNNRDVLSKILPAAYTWTSNKPLAERFDPALLASWVGNAEFSEALFRTMNADDHAPAVLGILADIAKAAPNDFKTYRPLALALAVVYDQTPPSFWPHHQVQPNLVPRVPIEPVEFFKQWVAADKARDLKTNLSEFPANQLKFIVDAPIKESEFAWARKNVKASRSDFEKVFSTISYDHRRIATNQFTWTSEPYTLANIANIGGICTDQAYFAATAGKAMGIPTLSFSGQGKDGGHAWFGYLRAPGRWNLNAGRFSEQNYVVGYAFDPQNWLPASDREFAELTDTFFDTPAYHTSENDRTMGTLLETAGEKDLAARAFATATAVAPRNAAAWRDRAEFLKRTAASPDERIAVHKAAVEALQKRRDLATWHQAKMAEALREKGDSAAAEKITSEIVSTNRHVRSDLSVSIGAEKILTLLKDGKTDEAMNEYRTTLRQLANTGGGNLFYELVRPFVYELRAMGKASLADSALQQARSTLSPASGSILDKDFARLAAEER